MHKGPHQQAAFVEEIYTLSGQELKVRLIDFNCLSFRKLVHLSLRIGLLRLFIFMLIIIFEEQFLISDTKMSQADSWSIIFYVIACMMDFLGLLNDSSMLKILKADEQTLKTIKTKILNKEEVNLDTRIGKYTCYLSIHQIISKYKYQSMPSASISQTVRFLHLIITFYIFGSLALNTQNTVEGQTFKIAFLWVFILSIYLNIFEIDLLVLEASKGPFLEIKQPGEERQENAIDHQHSDSLINKTIKERYIRYSRRPFQVIYIISILLMLTYLILFSGITLLNIIMVVCIITHITELIHQKYLQNKLVDLNLNQLPYQYLHPFSILHTLTHPHSVSYSLIRITNRFLMVLTIMAFFRQPNVSAPQFILFAVINLFLFIGQGIKFNRLISTKLYVLTPFTSLTHSQTECAICLLACNPSERLVQLPCFSQHLFHHSCMKKWFYERKECPLCRFSLNTYSIQ